MRLGRALLAIGAAILFAVALSPTSATAGPTRVDGPVSPTALLHGSCPTHVTPPSRTGDRITVTAQAWCNVGVDVLNVTDLRLMRMVGSSAVTVPGSIRTCYSSGSVLCTSTVTCETGLYYGSAAFEVYTTAGFREVEIVKTSTFAIAC
jgi:hypothetical protein